MRSRSIIVLAVIGCVACGPPADQETGSVDRDEIREAREALPAEALEHLDAGNERYRSQDYEAALEHYEQVVELAPDATAGWFGAYMAHEAMGNTAEADSALARARALARGASLIRPDTRDPGGTSP